MREYRSRSVEGTAWMVLDTGGLKGSLKLKPACWSKTEVHAGHPESVYEAYPCFLYLFCWCGSPL